MANALAAQQFRDIQVYLEWLGLSELFAVDADGNPGGWLWKQILDGIDTQEELQMRIEQTDVWKDRFSIIVEQRRRAAAGEPVQVMTPEEVVEYEYETAALFRRYNLPKWMYDKRDDFNSYILNGLSPEEIKDRIEGAYNTVANVDPDIKAQFREFYGVGAGDAALVAYFLDPEKTDAQLEKVALASYAGGIGKEYGIDLNRDDAELFSLIGRTEAGVAQDLSEVNAQSLLTVEGAGETNDLDVDLVFDAVVRGDAEARSLLERRQIRRQANARAGVGGALQTQQGLIGSGTAD